MKATKHTVRFAALLSALGVMLAGCTVGPDYQRPDANLPNRFAETEGGAPAAVQREWWKTFNDAALNDLVDQALKANLDVQQAVARIEEAEAYAREAGSARLPEIDLAGSAGRSRTSGTVTGAQAAVISPHNDFKLGLTTSFELDFWGKLRRAAENARDLALASRYARDTVQLSLVSLVSQNYLNLRALDAQLAVTRDSLESREAALKISQGRFKGGLASQLDVQQAESAKAALLAQIADLTQQRAVTQHQLALLAGKPGLTLAPGDFAQLPVPPVPPAGLPSSLLDARPDLRQAEAQLAAANAKIGVVKAALFPTISLTGGLGFESADMGKLFQANSRFWTPSLGLNLPIFDAGRTSARVDQATAQQKQSLAGYQKAVQTAFKEVDDALVTLAQTAVKEQAVDAQVQATQKVQRLAKLRYEAGYSPFLELLDAQRNANDARLTLIRARQARLTAAVDLFKALGGGWYGGAQVEGPLSLARP